MGNIFKVLGKNIGKIAGTFIGVGGGAEIVQMGTNADSSGDPLTSAVLGFVAALMVLINAIRKERKNNA